MFKYAGVVLDWHDDQGEMLKAALKERPGAPEWVKTAQMVPKGRLGSMDFALIMQDQGHVYHKYACYDPASTMVSCIYFEKHGSKLPLEARKVAAARLIRACTRFGHSSPSDLAKLASSPWVAKNLPTFSKIPGVGPVLMGLEDAARRGVGAVRDYNVTKRIGQRLGEIPAEVVKGTSAEGQRAVRDLSGSLEGAVASNIQNLSDKLRGTAAENVVALTKQVAPGMLAGSAAGALGGATHDDIRGGAARGLLAGALGGIGGRALGPGMGRAAAGGALLGAPAGALFGGSKEDEKKVASMQAVDVTGKTPKPMVKTAMPQRDSDYAVVLGGKKFYPIDSWDRVKVAERYFLEEGVRMAPHIRRQYAEKLAAKAVEIGYPINEKVAEHGSKTWAPADNIEASICARKTASDEGGKRFLEELFEKRASMDPDMYAECLRRYDVDRDLDHLWGRTIPDPWESTFGIDKTAEVIWESGTERLTDSQLFNLAENGLSAFAQSFSDHAASDFAKDPKGIFNSMPDPQKKIIARMAADVASSGGPAQNVIG